MDDLADYPRPHLAVDLVLLTAGAFSISSRRWGLGVVVLRREDGTAVLPGRFLRERQRAADALKDVLHDKLGLRLQRSLPMTMLDVYDDPDRDARAWAVSIGMVAGLPLEDVHRMTADVEVLPVTGGADRGSVTTPERLGYDHDAMVTTAVRRIRRRYERAPDPLGLLRPPYTLSQLRHVHEAVLDERLLRDTFARRMKPFLHPETDANGSPLTTHETQGRPAALFRPARPTRDPEAGPFPLPRSSSS